MAPGVQGARRLPPEFVRLVRERADIVEVVAQRVALRPAGREFSGLCPFHEERTPSFYVNRERQVFHCHGCQASGDVFTFIMRTAGLGFADAVAEVAARVGMALPETRPLSPEQQRRLARRQELLGVCAAALAFFRDCLVGPRGGPAVAYLRRRGVDAPTAERFGLGYAPPDGAALLQALGRRFPLEALVAAGVVAKRADGEAAPHRRGDAAPGSPARLRPEDCYDRFRGRLMFPIWDGRGRVIAFGGRALDPGERAKYLNSPETPLFRKGQTLYALHLARAAAERTGRVVVVEGYMDALSCHQFGLQETVAVLGTALSEEQAGILARTAESVVLAYDADPAGDQATGRGLAVLQEAGARVEVARLPAGRDPDELLRAEGRAALDRALERAEPWVRYLVRALVGPAGPGGLSPERRWGVARRVLPVLARLAPAVRAEYVEWVARELLLPPPDLSQALDGLTATSGEHRNSGRWNARPARVSTAAATGRTLSGAEAAEEIVLAAMLRSSEILRRLAAKLSIHEFRHPAHRTLVEALLALAGHPGTADGSPGADANGVVGRDSLTDRGVPAASGDAEDGGTAPGEGGGLPDGMAPGDALLDLVEELPLRQEIARLMAREVPGDVEAGVEGCLRTMRRASLWREREALQQAQRALAAQGRGIEDPEVRSLATRVAEVSARLMELTAARPAEGAARELDG
jgi:DNA primase